MLDKAHILSGLTTILLKKIFDIWTCWVCHVVFGKSPSSAEALHLGMMHFSSFLF